jgi:hypothetical protein
MRRFIQLTKANLIMNINERIIEINSTLLQLNYKDQDILLFWQECIKIAKDKQQMFTDDFKSSVNGKRLADKLNYIFSLQLLPKIKRHIKNDIKFLMMDQSGKVYQFKGIVLDFLANDVTIELENSTFSLY